jgi:acetoin utilization deacetylase AcuC-like enzyme
MTDEAPVQDLPIVYDDAYRCRLQPPGHPECPQRVEAIMARLALEGLSGRILAPRPADRDDLLAVHSPKLLARIEGDYDGYLDVNCYHHAKTYPTALLAAGGTIQGAVTAVDAGSPALVLPRPPGHHAGRDYYGGFCYFNNIAVAAEYLIRHRGLARVAIVDIDVHHGNGTADIFARRRDVLYISTHQWGIFPGTGALDDCGRAEGEGFTVNLPLPGGEGVATFGRVLSELIEPILRQYRPEAILVSMGLDAHYMDPLASIQLTSQGLSDVCLALDALAHDLCSGRILYVLEGGYHLEAIAETTAALVAGLTGRPLRVPLLFNRGEQREANTGLLGRFTQIQSRYWNL